MVKYSYYFPLIVSIDDREPDCGETELRDLHNMIIIRKRMEEGDYLPDSDLLIERKKNPDFCQSIKYERLFSLNELLLVPGFGKKTAISFRNIQETKSNYSEE